VDETGGPADALGQCGRVEADARTGADVPRDGEQLLGAEQQHARAGKPLLEPGGAQE
jgi:hypothetical protein